MNKTWICDIDGTVAIMGDRSPFDWSKVNVDTPNVPVVRVVGALDLLGDGFIFMSGRMEQCREATENWLNTYIGFTSLLLMRRDGDLRPDTVVKKELYENHVLGNYDVAGVIDDRNCVVKMWREELGLTVLHVADHDF